MLFSGLLTVELVDKIHPLIKASQHDERPVSCQGLKIRAEQEQENA